MIAIPDVDDFDAQPSFCSAPMMRVRICNLRIKAKRPVAGAKLPTESQLKGTVPNG